MMKHTVWDLPFQPFMECPYNHFGNEKSLWKPSQGSEGIATPFFCKQLRKQNLFTHFLEFAFRIFCGVSFESFWERKNFIGAK